MIDVVSIKFKSCGKVYYFAPNGTAPKEGDRVVVETANGRELAFCSQGVHAVADDRVVLPLQPVLRVATAADLRTLEQNKKREAEAFDICKKKIVEHCLDMKLVDVECNFDGNKITFFFTSDGPTYTMLNGGTLDEYLAVANFGSAPKKWLPLLRSR